MLIASSLDQPRGPVAQRRGRLVGPTGIRRVIVESVEEIAYGRLRVKPLIQHTAVFDEREVGRRPPLIGPTIMYQPSPDKPRVTMTAEYGQLERTEENALTVGCTTDDQGRRRYEGYDPRNRTGAIPLPDATNSRT